MNKYPADKLNNKHFWLPLRLGSLNLKVNVNLKKCKHKIEWQK